MYNKCDCTSAELPTRKVIAACLEGINYYNQKIDTWFKEEIETIPQYRWVWFKKVLKTPDEVLKEAKRRNWNYLKECYKYEMRSIDLERIMSLAENVPSGHKFITISSDDFLLFRKWYKS